MVWWGWGREDGPRDLPPDALEVLGRELGPLPAVPTPPPAAEAVVLPEPAPLPDLGDVSVASDRLTRLRHAAGRSYPDLVRLRSGQLDRAPDGVARPRGSGQVAAVLAACRAAGVAVVPFGGGTSVVGGVEPLAGGHAACLALDLSGLDRVLEVDARSQLAWLEPGLRGPQVERRLGARGLTLGHVPQSWEHATVGGWAATRSAGQASTGYGRIDDLVLGLRAEAPAGSFDLAPQPGSAAGPDLRRLLVGSEGVLAVLTAVALRVRPAPAHERYEGWSFPTWEDGLEALRALEQTGAAPDVARLSDPEETRISVLQAGSGAAVTALRAYRRLRGHAAGCLAVFGWAGDGDAIRRRRDRAALHARRHGGLALGPGPGASWKRGRFTAPYLRDTLLAHGVMAETLETATTWTGVPRLHAAVGDALRTALRGRGTPPVVLCHVSHLYATGASLYFTVLARAEAGAELEQWRAAKTAASEAIVAAGGTITHHHAVGTDHVPWVGTEVGETGLRALRAVKAELDPEGILNPGKLLAPVGAATG
jgi:alkyldihydroxyacetonephosphate synthase